MAALGKIRSKGVFLIIIIGLGLFGFIAGDMFRSCEATGRAASNKAAVIFGDKIDIQEYQKYVEQYVKVKRLFNKEQNSSDEALREEAWGFLSNYLLMKHECDELGLTVTDQEMAELLTKGDSPLLRELMSFGLTDNLGKFNIQEYRNFVKAKGGQDQQGKEMYDLIVFYENEILKKMVLMQKYEALVRSTLISNPYEAELALNATTTETDVKLAYIDYNSISDKDVQYNEDDIKKKFEQLKKSFYIPTETRSVKLCYVTKEPTASDKQKLENEMKAIAEELNNAEKPDSVVRANRSSYQNMLLPKNVYMSYPQVSAKLDSMTVGQVVGPIVDMRGDGNQTYSVVKLVDKATKNDSIGYKNFGLVVGQNNVTTENIKAKTDSILNAVKNGGNFDEIAKLYESKGDTTWISFNQIGQNIASLATWQKDLIKLVDEMGLSEVKTFEPQDGVVMFIKVIEKKKPIEMYNVALVQKNLEFSKETSNNIDEKFNKFLANNKTRDAIEKNAAKSGINLVEIPELDTGNNGIPDVVFQSSQVMPNSSEALRWAFTGKKDEISKVYSISYGADKEVKMVMMITGINKKGDQSLDNVNVRKQVEAMVKQDKKAEKIIAQLKDVKSIDQAEQKKISVVNLTNVSLGVPISNSVLSILPPYNPRTYSPGEPALNGAIAKAQKGQFSSHPVRGQYGVYVFEVTDKRTSEVDDMKKQNAAQQALQNNMRYISLDDLYLNAEIEDNRHLH